MKEPINLSRALQAGGIDGLLKLIDDHEEIAPGRQKEMAKRVALAEVIIMGISGRGSLPGEAASVAMQWANVPLEEVVIEAKVAAQRIPKGTTFH